MTKLAEYWKFIIATLTPLFLLVQGALEDDGIDQAETVAILVAAAVAVGVFLKRNKPAPEA